MLGRPSEQNDDVTKNSIIFFQSQCIVGLLSLFLWVVSRKCEIRQHLSRNDYEVIHVHVPLEPFSFLSLELVYGHNHLTRTKEEKNVKLFFINYLTQEISSSMKLHVFEIVDMSHD